MIKKYKKTILYICMIAWSFLTMLAMAMINHYGITGIELILPCLFALSIIVYMQANKLLTGEHKDKAKSDLKFAIPVGIVVDVCSVIGSHIDMYSKTMEDYGLTDIIYIFILAPFFVSIFLILFFSSDSVAKKLTELGVIGVSTKAKLNKKAIIKRVCIYAVIMLICWSPFYLTFFPGGVSNDNFKCINMIRGNIPWTNHHPVIYTATMKMFMAIFAGNGNLNLALGMMVLAQMIMLSVTLAASLVWLEYHGAGKVWCYISLAFMSLHSASSMIAVCLTKDISFACVVVLLTLFLYDFCNSQVVHSSKQFVILGILAFLTIITRNNGTLVIALLLITMITTLKKYRKQLLIVTIIVFALNGLYKGPVWKACGIEKQSFVEAASIPLTQIAYTIYSDGIIEGEDKEYLESIMPFDAVKKNFVPGYVDSYKFDKEFNTEIVDANPGRVITTWAHLLPKNFGLYVKAYLFETCGYWHYGVTNTLCSEGVQENDLGMYSTDYISKVTGISIGSILSGLMLIVRKLPILCMLTQMAVQLLMVILVECQFIRKKQQRLLIVLVPLFAIWISIMIAVPAYCLFRYMLPVFFLWPVLVYMYTICSK